MLSFLGSRNNSHMSLENPLEQKPVPQEKAAQENAAPQPAEIPEKWKVPTMEEAEALDRKNKTEQFEHAGTEWRAVQDPNSPQFVRAEIRAPEEQMLHWQLTRNLIEGRGTAAGAEAVAMVKGMSADAQEFYADNFFEHTMQQGGPGWGGAVETMQFVHSELAGTPFEAHFDQRENEFLASLKQ